MGKPKKSSKQATPSAPSAKTTTTTPAVLQETPVQPAIEHTSTDVVNEASAVGTEVVDATSSVKALDSLDALEGLSEEVSQSVTMETYEPSDAIYESGDLHTNKDVINEVESTLEPAALNSSVEERIMENIVDSAPVVPTAVPEHTTADGIDLLETTNEIVLPDHADADDADLPDLVGYREDMDASLPSSIEEVKEEVVLADAAHEFLHDVPQSTTTSEVIEDTLEPPTASVSVPTVTDKINDYTDSKLQLNEALELSKDEHNGEDNKAKSTAVDGGDVNSSKNEVDVILPWVLGGLGVLGTVSIGLFYFMRRSK
jgi:hypothetical protein